MEKTKRFLNISIGISIMLCALSLLAASIKGNTAKAQAPMTDGYIVAGNSLVGSNYYVIGYNPVSGDVKALGKIEAWKIRKSFPDQ